MFLTQQRDRDWLQFLMENDVVSSQGYAGWSKPDEGELLPVLVENAARYTAESYILAGLKADPCHIRVPHLTPDWQFIKAQPILTLNQLMDEFSAFPIRKLGRFRWFSFARFCPPHKERIAELLKVELRDCVWNIITPAEHADLLKQFAKQVSRFD